MAVAMDLCGGSQRGRGGVHTGLPLNASRAAPTPVADGDTTAQHLR